MVHAIGRPLVTVAFSCIASALGCEGFCPGLRCGSAPAAPDDGSTPVFFGLSSSDVDVDAHRPSRGWAVSAPSLGQNDRGVGIRSGVASRLFGVRRRCDDENGIVEANNIEMEMEDEYPWDKIKLEVVLFGVGDMRVSDHEGLLNALSACNATNEDANRSISDDRGDATRAYWVPLFILETEDTLPNLPQSASSLLDSASLLCEAVRSVDRELRDSFSPTTILQVIVGKDGEGLEECLVRAISEVVGHLDCRRAVETSADMNALGESTNRGAEQTYFDISVHICDLGDADNGIGFGPYSILQHFDLESRLSSHEGVFDAEHGISIEIKPWECNLRPEPWADLKTIDGSVDSLPDRYPDFVKRYDTLNRDASSPVLCVPRNNRFGTPSASWAFGGKVDVLAGSLAPHHR